MGHNYKTFLTIQTKLYKNSRKRVYYNMKVIAILLKGNSFAGNFAR